MRKDKETLCIKGSGDAPYVEFNKKRGLLKMGGTSLPENPLTTFLPILDWLNQYEKKPNETTKLEFFFEYLNTASSQMLMRIIDKIDGLRHKCKNILICWYYEPGDYDMRDTGMELLENAHCNYNLLEMEE